MSGDGRCLLCGVEILPLEEREGDTVASIAISVSDESDGDSVRVSGPAHGDCADKLVEAAIHWDLVQVQEDGA